MTDIEKPKIAFPCENYPIKIMGKADISFQDSVLDVVERHAPGFNRNAVQSRPSAKGNYMSVTVVITATGTEQLQAIFDDLKKNHMVQMVL